MSIHSVNSRLLKNGIKHQINDDNLTHINNRRRAKVRKTSASLRFKIAFKQHDN